MKLEIEGKAEIPNPTPTQIRDSLLDLGSEGHSFAILRNDRGDFLQSTGKNDYGFVIEFWPENNKREYYRSASNREQLNAVINLFIAFAENPVFSSITMRLDKIPKDIEGTYPKVNAYLALLFSNVLVMTLPISSLSMLIADIVIFIGWMVYIKTFGGELWKRIRNNTSVYQDYSYIHFLGTVFGIFINLMHILFLILPRSA